MMQILLHRLLSGVCTQPWFDGWKGYVHPGVHGEVRGELRGRHVHGRSGWLEVLQQVQERVRPGGWAMCVGRNKSGASWVHTK